MFIFGCLKSSKMSNHLDLWFHIGLDEKKKEREDNFVYPLSFHPSIIQKTFAPIFFLIAQYLTISHSQFSPLFFCVTPLRIHASRPTNLNTHSLSLSHFLYISLSLSLSLSLNLKNVSKPLVTPPPSNLTPLPK